MLQVVKVAILTLICLFRFNIEITCAEEQENYRVIDESQVKLTHPVFLKDIVHIKQPGTITSLNGEATIKYQDKNEYIELKTGDTVDYGDVLGLRANSTVIIMSGSSEIKLESKDKIRWFVFEEEKEPSFILKK